ncbi:protein of unknown function DUF4745 [Trinorchestia longiramus]|nr:protein of unknown function DUF4745 [Trinorchestia longiramus]
MHQGLQKYPSSASSISQPATDSLLDASVNKAGNMSSGSVRNVNYKPPLAPGGATQGNTAAQRARSNSSFSEGSTDKACKEKNGSRDDESVTMPSILDLHNCSIVLATYIQSLNEVCGSGSRLSQCIAALSSPHSNTNALLLKEIFDGWESLSKTLGVASAAVKAHMITLLQEATKLSPKAADAEGSDSGRSMPMDKLVSSLCLSFLSLQCQFSGAVLEVFSPFSSMVLPLTPPASMEHSPPYTQYSTPATPPHFSSLLTPPQSASGSVSNFAVNMSGPSLPCSAHGCRLRTRALSANQLNPVNVTGSQYQQNLLTPSYPIDPSSDSAFRRWSMGANDCHGRDACGQADNVSVDASGAKSKDDVSGPGPPRRWSVPETKHHHSPNSTSGLAHSGFDMSSWFGFWPSFPMNPSSTAAGGTCSPNVVTCGAAAITTAGATSSNFCKGDNSLKLDSGDAEAGRLNVPITGPVSSRESSVGGSRSNSHSRSATPDLNKSSQVISSDELDEVVDMFRGCLRASTSLWARNNKAYSTSKHHNVPEKQPKTQDSKACSKKPDASAMVSVGKEEEAKEDPALGSPAMSSSPSATVSVATNTFHRCKHRCGRNVPQQHSQHHHFMCIKRKTSTSESECGTHSSSKRESNASNSSEAELTPRSRDDLQVPKGRIPSCQASVVTSAGGSIKKTGATFKTASASLGKTHKLAAVSGYSSQHRQRSLYHHFPSNVPAHHKQQYQQYQQQMQLHQLLIQQQLHSNTYNQLSTVSPSILKQQQYLNLLQQQFYHQQQQKQQQQQQQQHLQMQQLQQMKLNQLLHLQQQQQHQQHRVLQQHRKNSLQNLSSYAPDVGAALFSDRLDESSTSNTTSTGAGGSRRGSGNTSITSSRTPVIHETTLEAVDATDGTARVPLDARTSSMGRVLQETGAHHQQQQRSVYGRDGSGAHTAACEELSERQRGNIRIPDAITTSTPLWPASGSVPGVTLTECTDEFKQQPPQPTDLPPTTWPPTAAGPECTSQESRDAPSRASWPFGHSLWGNGFSLGGLIADSSTRAPSGSSGSFSSSSNTKQLQPQAFLRRHSDTSSFGPYHTQANYQQQLQPTHTESLLQHQHQQHQQPLTQRQQQYQPLRPLSPGRNSRSSDHLHHIHLAPESGEGERGLTAGGGGLLDANLEALLALGGILPSSSPPSPTAPYSLFSNRT